jgi:hypothetical protein
MTVASLANMSVGKPEVAGCGSCLRFRRRQPPANMSGVARLRWKSRYGFCHWPGMKPAPYWHAEHPGGELMVADCHGKACPAFKERKR